MGFNRTRVVIGLFVVAGVALAAWGLFESHRQRLEIEEALVGEARVLASSLGPGMAVASSSVGELDELVTWRLLDIARLLARLHAASALNAEALAGTLEESGLDSVALFDRQGTVRALAGEPVPMELGAQLEELTTGIADELILGSSVEDGVEHLGVAVGTHDGGAVLVRIHPTSSRTFARRLGVENLLHSLVGSGGVLYLAYAEEPGGTSMEASWDGGPVPVAIGGGRSLKSVRARDVFEVEVPVDAPAGIRRTLRVGLDAAPLNRAAAAATRRTLLVGLVLAGFGLAVAGVAIVSRLRALEREEAAAHLAAAEEARRRSERLAAAGMLTAGLAHEVRSPLNAIGLAAQRIERGYSDNEECSRFAGRIRQEVQRLEAVLRQFLEFARPVSSSREDLDLAELAAEVIGLLADEANDDEVRLEPVEGAARVHVDREAVRRALINLMRNAMQASFPGGRVRTIVDVTDDAGRVRILDEGNGVDEETAEKLFEAFFTTRVKGSGLGLSLVRRVVEEHGGDCSIRNRDGGGAEATIRLPLAAGGS
jgi:signal transduction histidine kinase